MVSVATCQNIKKSRQLALKWSKYTRAAKNEKNGKFNIKTFFSIYRKVVSSNTSLLEAHTGFFRLLMKGIFDTYIL